MSTTADATTKALDQLAIANFQEYLRIPSVHPDINYDACVTFLKAQAKTLDLPVEVYNVDTNRPVVIITWEGYEPTLPAIMLNSHMDVVPVFEDQWTHKPFSADIDEKGNIYARGSQDMKCVGIQYLEAIRRLKRSGARLRRTLRVTFVPEEELGGVGGMKQYVHTQHFKDMNVGFALDEGMANPSDEFVLSHGERVIWQVHIHCPGQPGHGSLLLDNTAGEKAQIVLDRFMRRRAEEKKKLQDNPKLTIGDVLTINLTHLRGGVQTNVLPNELVVTFDMRVPVTVNLNDFEAMINGWCKEAGSDVWIEYEQKQEQIPVTKIDNTNAYWLAFKEAIDELGLKVNARIFPGGTDSRYVRKLGIPAIGFSPMNKTPILLHDHDEYLNKDIFLRGIDIYYKILQSVANLEETTG